ncbi:hypothetical protein ACU8KH_02296 [Lachancea thermotolerans]
MTCIVVDDMSNFPPKCSSYLKIVKKDKKYATGLTNIRSLTATIVSWRTPLYLLRVKPTGSEFLSFAH